MVREKVGETGVQAGGAWRGDDVDGCAARAPEFSCIIAPINLEFLHAILAEVRADSAGIIIELTTIHGNAVSSAIAAIEGKPALRRLFHSKVCVTGQPGGVSSSRNQQGVGEIVTARDGQVLYYLPVKQVCLGPYLWFHPPGPPGSLHHPPAREALYP